ncbi:MAG: tetratricopeptide repeat protein [Bacteroidetes bacterium]|nr:tetratricopeptide repeat protein [Bacteroidota bacterium]
MKSLLAFIILISSAANLVAQSYGRNRLDSLLGELPKASVDTHKVFLMAQISYSYSTILPDSGLIYGTKAIELAKQINWEKGIGNSYYFRGANYLNMSMLPESLDDYLNARKYFEKAGDLGKLAGTLSNIGAVYAYQGKEEKALEYFLKALDINRKHFPGGDFEAANLGNIGVIYYNRNDLERALDFQLQALNIYKKKNRVALIPHSEVSIAGVYIGMKNYEEALKYSQQALDAARDLGDESVMANSYAYIGTAILHIVTQNNQKLLDSLYRGNKEAALNEARSILDSALTKIEMLGDKIQLATVYTSLIELEEYRGNYKQALAYLKIYKASDDSLFTSDNNDKILQSAMQYEFEKKEATARLEQEKKDAIQKNIRNAIAGGLIGTSFFLLIVYRQRNKISKEKARSEELLLNILPSEVAQELKTKGSADARQFDQVTVMFTDFKGFTQISERLTPAELVAEIHTCFKAFDNIITKYNIEKIKTIGDAYMCAGGLPVANTTHATDVVSAALEIQQFMKNHLQQRKQENKEGFEIRIGIHTGTVVAGIVGVKKFAYDIWGDTVNLASRIESSGEAGKVNISSSTYAWVKDKFHCVHRGKIEAKNKGEIDMYFVEGRNRAGL